MREKERGAQQGPLTFFPMAVRHSNSSHHPPSQQGHARRQAAPSTLVSHPPTAIFCLSDLKGGKELGMSFSSWEEEMGWCFGAELVMLAESELGVWSCSQSITCSSSVLAHAMLCRHETS